MKYRISASKSIKGSQVKGRKRCRDLGPDRRKRSFQQRRGRSTEVGQAEAQGESRKGKDMANSVRVERKGGTFSKKRAERYGKIEGLSSSGSLGGTSSSP